jgi:5-methyltetrahydrofolate--homocysteine methyltransferase
MSALMTTTMVQMEDVIKKLDELNLHQKIKVLIGGAPTTEKWTHSVGGDGHGIDAIQAVETAKKLVKQK